MKMIQVMQIQAHPIIPVMEQVPETEMAMDLEPVTVTVPQQTHT